MATIKRKDFRLVKLNLLSNKGVEARFETKENMGGDAVLAENKKKLKAVRHPHLDDACEKFLDHIIEVVGLKPEAAEDIEMIGISVSGKNESEGVVISAKMDVLNGRVISINTPNILFDDPDYNERESVKKLTSLQSLVKSVENEVYGYFFEDKLAQQTIGFPDTGANGDAGDVVEKKEEEKKEDQTNKSGKKMQAA